MRSRFISFGAIKKARLQLSHSSRATPNPQLGRSLAPSFQNHVLQFVDVESISTMIQPKTAESQPHCTKNGANVQ